MDWNEFHDKLIYVKIREILKSSCLRAWNAQQGDQNNINFILQSDDRTLGIGLHKAYVFFYEYESWT